MKNYLITNAAADGTARTIKSTYFKLGEKNFLPGGYGGGYMATGIIEEQIEETLKENGRNLKIRIRKLTPRECWRLMDFDDASFEKAEAVNSNTQLYKQAGNSIVVGVLEAILKPIVK